jgi:CRP-like cAMP-binding protein
LARVARNAPITNQLLDRLPARDRAHLLARCERVVLSFPQILAEPGQTVRHVYFPTGSMISLVTPMDGRMSLQVALTGNEGMYGVGIALGVGFSHARAMVQGTGSAWRIGAAAFPGEFARSPALRKAVYRYVYVLMSQLSQTAACVCFHVVEQRLARWLLMSADRVHAPTFHITHEFLAYILGVRREKISKAASALQRRKLIAYKRGEVAILDREGLERAACSCYEADLAAYKQIFGMRPRPSVDMANPL